MARGMVVGETPTSQAQTKAFDEGYERAGLGKSEGAKERGRFVWDEKRQKLARPWEVEMHEESRAIDAPVMSGRFYENTATVDGEDIGSRQKRKDYMRRAGVIDANEAHEDGRRQAKEQAEATKKHRREMLTRELYRVIEMPEERYRKELKARERERLRRGEEGL